MMDEQESSLISPWTPEWCSVCEADVGYAKWRISGGIASFDPYAWDVLRIFTIHNDHMRRANA